MELHPSLMTAGHKFNAEKGQLEFIRGLETLSVTQPQQLRDRWRKHPPTPTTTTTPPQGSKTRGGLQDASVFHRFGG